VFVIVQVALSPAARVTLPSVTVKSPQFQDPAM
jgi:hypothetical protein